MKDEAQDQISVKFWDEMNFNWKLEGLGVRVVRGCTTKTPCHVFTTNANTNIYFLSLLLALGDK